ncbi:fimbrial biogenesis outer membrane usher protein [Pseudomonas sp. S75]|uniref:fimbria/pilus outer membrane usher protein n=1 Tax=unclassified Pseudomonas TaxID=196821 RepID=UPI0019055FB3|nr:MULTISPECIES: fimbria/pilus outer membrane usher protein [unclassified Pseudomonas]MBJ9976668.1 fimbrial biogenesis outer membrane usher protein [Pseudomonas sp. S30]MBK0153670.1 fimbrial biogenesis outer membrane usher protein [Pseudomonas sp. S75]
MARLHSPSRGPGAALALGLAWSAGCWADYRFNPMFISQGRALPAETVAQLERLGRGQLPGTYEVELSMNDRLVGRRRIEFISDTQNLGGSASGLYPCLSIEQLQALGVQGDTLRSITVQGQRCVLFGSILDGLRYTHDFNHQRLRLQVPQAYLGRPSLQSMRQQWTPGENVAFLNYGLSGSQQQSSHGSRHHQFGSLNSGVNLGNWRLRNFSTLRSGSSGSGTRMQSLENYAQRDLPDFMATLTLGDAQTDGELFDALPYRGVSLASDLGMLPDQAQGFAPVIRGTATGRSRVQIRQNGNLINERWVPGGPFVIDDLYQTANNGDLDIRVIGEDGTEQRFTQSFTSVPSMLREGQTVHAFMAGQYRPGEGADLQRPGFVQLTTRRGLASDRTLYGGIQASEDYQAAVLGLATSLRYFGALSLDVTQAHSGAVGLRQRSRDGQSYRVRYAKSFAPSSTNFSLVGYRYSTAGYYSLQEMLESQRDQRPDDAPWDGGHVRSGLTGNIVQPLNRYGAIYVSASRLDYWNRTRATSSLQAGYNFSWGDASWSLTASHSSGSGPASNSLALSVSLPLGRAGSSQRLSLSHSQGDDHRQFSTATLSGNALADQSLGYSVQVGQRTDERRAEANYTLSARYTGTQADVQASYSEQSQSRQLDYAVQGGIVHYRHATVFTQPLGETNIIVEAPGAAGVPVVNRQSVATDAGGYTVLPSTQPYRVTRVALQAAELPDDIEIRDLVQRVTPTRGAFALARFDTRQGRRILLTLTDLQQRPAPFAATAVLRDEQGQVLGDAMVGNQGQVYLTGVPARSRLSVRVGQQLWCQLDLQLPPETSAGVRVQRLERQCPRPAPH